MTELEKVLGDINRARRCYQPSDETLQSRLLETIAIELAKLVDIVQGMKN